jgi:hypothetical protein
VIDIVFYILSSWRSLTLSFPFETNTKYIIGILAIILIGSGTKLNYDQRREYNSIMNTIDLQAEFDASQEFWMEDRAYRTSKGWFTCDGLCQRKKRRMEDAKYKLDQIRMEGQARMSDANIQ